MSTLRARLALVLACCALGACTSVPEKWRALPPMVFEGAQAFQTERLKEVVADEVGDAVVEKWERSAVDDGAFAIERFYRSQGFAFAHVDWKLVTDPKGPDRAKFEIVPGPRVSLESLRLSGVTAFTAERVASFFPELPRSTPLVLGDEDVKRSYRGGPPWWDRAELQSAAEDLEDQYYRAGYLEARVSPPRETFDDEQHGASVVIDVHEGVRSRISKVVVRGAPAEIAEIVQKTADSFVDRPYSPLNAGAVRARLEQALSAHGYPDGKATLDDTRAAADGATTLVVVLEPGVLVRIDGIQIHGRKRTRRNSVLGFLKLAPGDVYSADKEHESFRALYQSGLFSSVHVGLEPGDSELRDLVVEIVEAPSIEVYVEPGYGSYERFRVGAGLRYRNLFGTGRTLELMGTLGELAQSGRVNMITPNAFGTDLRSTVSLFTNRREEPTFTVREAGVGWLLSRRWTRTLTTALGYEFRSTSVSHVDIIGPQVQALIDAVEISSVSLTPTWDTRDSVFAPTTGQITKSTLEIADHAIGSELDFLRLRLAHTSYFSPWKTGVLALSWRTGVITPIDRSDDIPLQERFFNGGESTVRSFREDQLGPTDTAGTPLGGETYHVFTAELRHKLRGNLDGAVFYDVGNVQLEHQDYFELSGFRSAIGVGLRYVLPIGPIRLDYGVNPDPGQGESAAVLHFAVGMAF